MNREEAIKILEYPVKKWSMEWDEREDGLSYYEALDLAISALRQQETAANRNGLIGPVEYGCEYCNDPHPARDCVVDGNLEQMLVGRSFSDAYVQTRRIKFCPMCGRKLLEEGPV